MDEFKMFVAKVTGVVREYPYSSAFLVGVGYLLNIWPL